MPKRKKIGLIVRTRDEQIDAIQISCIQKLNTVEELVFVDADDLFNNESKIRDILMSLIEDNEIYTTLPKRLIDPIGLYHGFIHLVYYL